MTHTQVKWPRGFVCDRAMILIFCFNKTSKNIIYYDSFRIPSRMTSNGFLNSENSLRELLIKFMNHDVDTRIYLIAFKAKTFFSLVVLLILSISLFFSTIIFQMIIQNRFGVIS